MFSAEDIEKLYLGAKLVAVSGAVILIFIFGKEFFKFVKRLINSRKQSKQVDRIEQDKKLDPVLFSRDEFYDAAPRLHHRDRIIEESDALDQSRGQFGFRSVVFGFVLGLCLGGGLGVLTWHFYSPLLLDLANRAVDAAFQEVSGITGDRSIRTEIGEGNSNEADVGAAAAEDAPATNDAPANGAAMASPSADIVPTFTESVELKAAEDTSSNEANETMLGIGKNIDEIETLTQKIETSKKSAQSNNDDLDSYIFDLEKLLPYPIAPNLYVVELGKFEDFLGFRLKLSRILDKDESKLFALTAKDRSKHIVCDDTKNSRLKGLIEGGVGLYVVYVDKLDQLLSRIALRSPLCGDAGDTDATSAVQ